ncbi:MAG: TetR/AcrR family transcriptional regulator [Chloroflexota bacterium]|nr:MAG: TetR/AcrR family transcriptional regulator [Chloroflexota bacterium]
MNRIVKDAEIRRAEILDTAQQLFLQKGYEQTSIQDIIDVIGIAKGTFYHYFDSKSQLLNELIGRMLNQTVQMVEPIVRDENLDALEKFQLYFSEIVSWKTENKAFMLDILRAWYRNENAIFRFKLTAASIEAVVPPLTTIIHQGVAEGVFTTCYPDDIGEIILSTMRSLSEGVALMILNEEERAILNEEERANMLSTMERKSAVHQYAIERLLGAPAGSLQLFDIQRLHEWVV